MGRLALILILGMSLAIQALAVGKITVDPNTPEARAQAPIDEGFWTADSCLATEVSIEVKHKTVSSILSELGKQSGIQLYSGLSDQDWQVRDRKMTICARKIPLASLLQSIGRVMKFKWSRTKANGTYTYRLFMDRRALADAEAQGYRQEEQFYQKQRQKRESLADSLGDLANISDEDLANLKETNPMLYALTASGIAGSLRQVFDNVPGMREAFINNSAMSVSIKDAPEQTRNAMLGIAQGILKMSPGSDRPTANALAENPEILLEVSVKPPFNANDAESMISRFTLGEIDIMYKRINSDGSDMGPCEEGFPILDSETSFGKSLGGLFAKALDTGSLPNVWSINFDPKELMQQDFGEPLAKHGNDVIIQGEVDFSLKEKYEPLRLDDKLAKFSDATKLNVVSDSFATDTLCDFGKLPAVKFLEGLELINSCNWWKRGTTIELRNRHWFYKRSLEIPEYYLEKWRKQVEDTSTLDIDALADMAVLVGDDRQYKMNIAQDETLNNDSLKWLLQINSRILTFYATLTQSQRAAISTQAGLDLSTLTSAQKKNEYLNHWDGKMVVTKTAKGKQLEYCFIRDGKTISQITTPKYDVPKKNTQ